MTGQVWFVKVPTRNNETLFPLLTWQRAAIVFGRVLLSTIDLTGEPDWTDTTFALAYKRHAAKIR